MDTERFRICGDLIQEIESLPNLFPAGSEKEVCQLLEMLVVVAAPAIALEIGTSHGYTTAHLIRASGITETEIITIDIRDQRHPSLKKLHRWHRHIEMDSVDALKRGLVPAGVGFCFIDGKHKAPHVKVELDLLAPLLAAHCLLAVHDTLLFPRIRAVVEEFAESKGFTLITIRTPNHPKKKCDSTGLTLLSRKCLPKGPNAW